jgi:CRISPR-associated protein Csd1
VGDATTVAWSAKSSNLEHQLGLFFGSPKDNPDAHTEAVASLYASIRNGAYVEADGKQQFFVLGLSPNNARIAVRFWHVGTVASFSERIARHFDELDIDGREHYGRPDLFRLLLSTAALHKADNINPTLAGALIRAILEDQLYPEALLSAALRRAAIERDAPYHRAALIKACLCRKYRKSDSPQKELTVSLDTNRTTPGYRLGRLFAVLERAQEAASPGLNATIRERYYSAASTTPGSVFATLLRLSNHHLAKLNPGNQVFYEKLLGEIIDGIGQFPAHLDLNQQGEFAIGYYHQRQALFRKREKSAEAETAITE